MCLHAHLVAAYSINLNPRPETQTLEHTASRGMFDTRFPFRFNDPAGYHRYGGIIIEAVTERERWWRRQARYVSFDRARWHSSSISRVVCSTSSQTPTKRNCRASDWE